MACFSLFAIAWWLFGGQQSGGSLHALIVLLSLAMGIQAAAVRHLGVPGIATTYITGTLTSLMVDLVGWMRSAGAVRPGEDGKKVNESSGGEWEQRVGLLAGVFFVYGLGALAGGVLQTRSPALATFSPLIAVGLVVMNASIRYRRAY
jgi:uncharacterized membrane protein YoaK (UPF0700 family)